MKNTRGISTMGILMFMVLMTLQHNLDFTDSKSIPWQEAQNVALDYITFSNQSEFKNCSTNSDCAPDQGETCVSGICFCNRFGWRYEPYEWYDRCNRITCTRHAECRSHFGQGAYCEASHYCSCATEIDPMTQQCADPFLQINAKCAEDSTCKQNFGTDSHCKCNTVCVCNRSYRFSPSQRKCVPMEENVWANDWQFYVQLYLAVAVRIISILGSGIMCFVAWDKVKSLLQNVPGKSTVIPIEDSSKNSTPQKPEFVVSLPNIAESPFCEQSNGDLIDLQPKDSCHMNPPPEYSPPLHDSLAVAKK